MALSALLSIGLPIGLFIGFRRKYHAPFIALMAGITGFTLFALTLERGVHSIVLQSTVAQNRVFFVVYAVLMAGIFEESARFIAYHLLKKKFTGITLNAALAYGVGHGGIEAILLTGLTMINNIVISVMINTGSIETVLASLEGATLEQAKVQFSSLATVATPQFLIGGIERVFAIGIQLSLSVLVFYAVFGTKRRQWLYPLAILIHALFDIPAVLYQVQVLNLVTTEVLTGVFCIALITVTLRIHQNFGTPLTPTKAKSNTI
jgi:uncharacterized membrane protein YhfC